MNNRIRPILFKILKFAIIGAIFYFVINNVVSNWEQMAAQGVHFDAFYALLSILVMMLAWLTTSWSWGKTLEAFGAKLKYRDVFVIYFRSMIGKYLPGKFWQIVGMTYVGAQKGVPEGLIISSAIISQAYSVLTGAILFSFAIVILDLKGIVGNFLSPAIASIPILLLFLVVVVRPVLMVTIINRVLGILKRQKIEVRIGLGKSLEIFALFLVPWFIFGLSFWFLGRSLTPIPFSQYPLLLSIAVGATIIGFLAIFTPGGIGVREGLIVILMTAFTKYPVPLASALALCYRIVMSLVEIMAFGLTWVIERYVTHNGSRV